MEGSSGTVKPEGGSEHLDLKGEKQLPQEDIRITNIDLTSVIQLIFGSSARMWPI